MVAAGARHPRRRQRRCSARRDPERRDPRAQGDGAPAADGDRRRRGRSADRSDVPRARALRRNRPDGRRLLRELLRLVRGRPHRLAARDRAGPTARWKTTGFALPVIEAHCEYREPAPLRRRAGDPDDGRRCCRRCGWRSTTRSCARRTARRWRPGHTVHADARSQRAGRAGLPARVEGAVRMKALVTGGAGFIGSHLTERLLATAPRSSASTASPTTTRGRSRKRTSPACAAAPGYRFVESAIAGRRPAGAARRRDARVPPRRPGRRAQELGTRLPRSTRDQRGRDAAAARGLRRPADRARRLRVELVGLRRRRAAADARGRAAAAGVAVRRDQAGRRAALLPVFRQPRRADGLAALFHGLRSAPAARHGLPPVPHARLLDGPSGGAVRRRRADARLHFRRRRGRGHTPAAAVRGVPGRVYNIGGGFARLAATRCST